MDELAAEEAALSKMMAESELDPEDKDEQPVEVKPQSPAAGKTSRAALQTLAGANQAS
eukprot:COSAG03_NODE_28_length_18724_cov_10.718128_9_plen_58_part_00